MSDWISVKNRIPKDFESVLVCRRDGYIGIAFHRSDEHYWCYPDDDTFVPDGTKLRRNILAWMPLPEPYKEEL